MRRIEWAVINPGPADVIAIRLPDGPTTDLDVAERQLKAAEMLFPDNKIVLLNQGTVIELRTPEEPLLGTGGSFTGSVMDAGGGVVEILVSRDTKEYPAIGSMVTVTVDVAGEAG